MTPVMNNEDILALAPPDRARWLRTRSNRQAWARRVGLLRRAWADSRPGWDFNTAAMVVLIDWLGEFKPDREAVMKLMEKALKELARESVSERKRAGRALRGKVQR